MSLMALDNVLLDFPASAISAWEVAKRLRASCDITAHRFIGSTD
jgi:hypothetical protein